MPGEETQKIPCKDRNKCSKKNCKYCSLLDRSGEIKSKKSGEKFHTKTNITCKSSNIVYCIECKQCQTQYVGQTLRMMKERIGEHLSHIQKKRWKNDVPVHFNLDGHHGENDVRVYILDYIFCHPRSDRGKKLRLHVENNWVQRLKTQSPWGMNTMDSKYG